MPSQRLSVFFRAWQVATVPRQPISLWSPPREFVPVGSRVPGVTVFVQTTGDQPQATHGEDSLLFMDPHVTYPALKKDADVVAS